MITETDTFLKVTKLLSKNNINIEYAYSSGIQINGKTALVIRASDNIKTEKILTEKGVTVLSLEQFKKHFS